MDVSYLTSFKVAHFLYSIPKGAKIKEKKVFTHGTWPDYLHLDKHEQQKEQDREM